jgi:hypothetical protein
MTTYFVCDGVVSTVGNGNNQGLKCSTGWQQAVEPVYTLISQQQGDALIGALLSLAAVYAVFKILFRIVR